MALPIMDNSQRYGVISRLLHWGMALLFAWQFTSATAHWLFPDTPFEEFFWGTHYPVGSSAANACCIEGVVGVGQRVTPPAIGQRNGNAWPSCALRLDDGDSDDCAYSPVRFGPLA